MQQFLFMYLPPNVIHYIVHQHFLIIALIFPFVVLSMTTRYKIEIKMLCLEVNRLPMNTLRNGFEATRSVNSHEPF